MNCESPTLQTVFRRHFPRYAKGRRLTTDMWKAASRVSACRTPSMGIHLRACPRGHFFDVAYNSCRHRFCPQCSSGERIRWLERRSKTLLSCPHHHVVFTTPRELLVLWRYNKRLFANLLFRAANEALIELMADPKYCGARPGILAALHTWSQQLCGHVHLHVLVTAGGLTEDHRWVHPTRDCLLPRKVLMIVFRGKLRHLLINALQNELLRVPPTGTVARWKSTLNRLGRIPWNVKIHERYPHANGVLTYLARYLRGGPMPNSRLLSDDKRGVRFRYRLPLRGNSQQERKRFSTTCVTADEFLRRVLEHVPPKGLQTVRGYGLYAGNQHSRLADARAALARLGQAPPQENLNRTSPENASPTDNQCPHCGEKLIRVEINAPPRPRFTTPPRPPPPGPHHPTHI